MIRDPSGDDIASFAVCLTAVDLTVLSRLIETITAEFKGHSMLHLRPTPEAVALFQHEVGEV